MGLSVTCECGITHPVTAAKCGQSLKCSCGRSVQVPMLSELRKAAGLQAFEIGIHDRIDAMNREGRLPVEHECVVCGTPTQEKVMCCVECERPYAKGPGFWKSLFLTLLTPVWMLGAMRRDQANPEVLGRELVVKTPIRICRSCRESDRFSRSRCVELLRKTDVYRNLLDAYPEAAITVDGKSSR